MQLVVKDVYNSDYNSREYHAHNLKKLMSYVQTNTDKLGAIGAYLVEKLGRRVRKAHDGYVAGRVVTCRRAHARAPSTGTSSPQWPFSTS